MSKTYKSGDKPLRDMIDALEKIRSYLSKTTEADFLKQEEAFDAVCMQLLQLGEQVKRLEESPDRVIQNFADEVDWPALRGLRNRISHSYVSVDAKQVWQFATLELDDIEHSLKRILKKRYGADSP